MAKEAKKTMLQILNLKSFMLLLISDNFVDNVCIPVNPLNFLKKTFQRNIIIGG
jgi:hypothetical protein